ncbi:MAG: hypothetical protein UU48_C0021G0006 [Candidatus Uhrbacteria bacterium GW2011_GWF2_41_16]|uniref:TIR domain-containing protein n=1 Tax=Candidatus Uhrbacteria bacterium GW2011_GWF2_41_16 TaxID=1618997 RepID=A0A0G0VBA3_9BACT|nr:MAG: hypothetical protein UU48_C0021G0006 [Candidatus Uhrbacteria bacterium GW2011_GWF2_41_16]
MGGTKRQFVNMYVKFTQRFKKPFDSIAKLMPINFSDNEFLKCFKTLYEYFWIDIEREYSYWEKKNDDLIHYGKKSRYDFPKPEEFVLKNSVHVRTKYRNNHKTGVILPKEEQEMLYIRLSNHNQIKLNSKKNKEFEKLELVQEIEPKFVQEYINKYFCLRNISQDIIDEKFKIIREIAKYKADKTVKFLQKVNAKETNYSLKQEAFKSLQQLNEKVILRRKKMGKKKESVEAIYNTTDSPDNLIEKLNDNTLEKIKSFDVFLSHSSSDRKKVILLYKNLNSKKLHVYIDWVNDSDALKRNLSNRNTANVIIERLKKSKMLIYCHTEASMKSQWASWEIGYFHGIGRQIFVFNPDNFELPDFLKVYPKLIEKDSEYYIENKSEKITLNNWIFNK